MLIRVNGEFLDYEGNIEVEKQSKLFEQLNATQGDFSYSFELPKTSKNLKAFQLPFPDNASKTIYQNVVCDILDDDGLPLYYGQLRVQRIKKSIECSFFSGNFNWFSLITGSVSDLDFSEYDIDLEEINIINSTVNTDGVVFPLMDIGGLKTRSSQNLMTEDFNAAIYLKTIFNKIFFKEGIKIKGELLNDWDYNNITIVCNNKNDEGITARSSYAQKTSNQTVTNLAAYAKILFQDDSTYPYYDGTQNNYSSSVYTADIKMSVKVEVNLVISMNNQLNTQYYRIKKNSSTYREYANRYGPGVSPPTSYSINSIVTLEAGDTLQIDIKSVDSIGTNTGVQMGSTLKVTPLYIYRVIGRSAVPKWTKQQFVSNVLSLFNVVTDYDPFSKEITFNFFDKIKSKQAIDISKYITSTDVDFEEFIANFAKNNILSYNEDDNDDIKEYNVKNKLKYTNGLIQVDNDFIQEEADILQSDFTAPISYINGALNASLEYMQFIELIEGDSVNFTSVSAGVFAQFNVTADLINDSDLVRISDSTDPSYNGDYVVQNAGGGVVFLQDVFFNADASGRISKLNYKYTNNNNVYLMINIPNSDTADYSGYPAGIYMYPSGNQRTNYTYGYFNLLNSNKTINTLYNQGLSFGPVNNPLFYQLTLLDTYWKMPGRILNDPVKLIETCYFPKSVFLSLSPLIPVFVNTEDTTNLYYMNRISGYINSYLPCEVELIKL